jgi:hypothetical protein
MPSLGARDDPVFYVYVRGVAELPPIEDFEEASDPAWLFTDDDRPADRRRVANVSVSSRA